MVDVPSTQSVEVSGSSEPPPQADRISSGKALIRRCLNFVIFPYYSLKPAIIWMLVLFIDDFEN
jgi:hypothetical protein